LIVSEVLAWLAGIGPGAWALLAAAAVAVLWMVGAYNRLMALRNAVLQAWQPAHAALQQRQSAFAPLLQALREPLAAEHRALDQWLTHHTEAARTLAALAAQPLQADAAAAWVAAESQLGPSTSRVMALLDSHRELRQQPELRAPLDSWQQADAQLGFGRQLFNTAAQAHDSALLQWPTRLLIRLFSLAPVGRL
jgi:LemA protein